MNMLSFSHNFHLLIKDHKLLDCNGPQYLANAVADLFPKHRQDICILDVAAGTGLVGIEVSTNDWKLAVFVNFEYIYLNSTLIIIDSMNISKYNRNE